MGKNKGMKTNHAWYGAALLLFGSLVSCMGTVGNSSMRGGEVIGASAVAWNEPAPYGMVLVKRGSVKMGPDKQDSLWGTIVPSREISVESFWMDDTEVTVAEYKQFVNWVRDSIIRERLADPAYIGILNTFSGIQAIMTLGSLNIVINLIIIIHLTGIH